MHDFSRWLVLVVLSSLLLATLTHANEIRCKKGWIQSKAQCVSCNEIRGGCHVQTSCSALPPGSSCQLVDYHNKTYAGTVNNINQCCLP